MIEHQREEQYLKSFKEDAEADIKQIDRLEIEFAKLH